MTAASAALAATTPGNSPHVVIWDTGQALGDKISPGDFSNWNLVPKDLLQLEKDPAKASSDPGYYGREYIFSGDAVVETPTSITVFWSRRGAVTVLPKSQLIGTKDASKESDWTTAQGVDLSPIGKGDGSAKITQVSVLRNAGSDIVMQVVFAGEQSAVFSFDKTGVVEARPVANLAQLRIRSPMEYGIVPDFTADDLVFGGPDQPESGSLVIPAESCFVGLLGGENAELLLSWPKGKQRLNATLTQENGKPVLRTINFDTDGQSLYLSLLSAPGIWHKETLGAESLEKDAQIAWKRPFPARWKTQLYEEEVKTTFAFRQSRGEIWRGVAGSYVYPAWFNGDDAYLRLGKKVQPKGEALIYCLEGQDTPDSILTPADFLKQTLGRQIADSILDLTGRKLRTHHRRGATGVRRACTCGCTEAIQAIFEGGEEVNQKEYIAGALDDMIFFVQCHVARINEYKKFAESTLTMLDQKRRSSPELKEFTESLGEIVSQIPQECENQREHMKNQEYADSLVKKTIALTDKKDPGNVKAYMELLKAWRDMGGSQDYVVAKCHTLTRKLSQGAGYGCATQPKAIQLAQEIRARCRQMLRNPDGYEVWADY